MNPLEMVMSFFETIVHVLRPPIDIIPWKIRNLLSRLYDYIFDDIPDDHCLICHAKWGENLYIGQELDDAGFSSGQIKWLFNRFEYDEQFFKKVMSYCSNIQWKKYTNGEYTSFPSE